MRNRLRKSRQPSVTSITSGSLPPPADDAKDPAHSQTISVPNDSPRTSLTHAPEALVNSRTMGISSRGSARGDKPLPSVPATTAFARSSASPAPSPVPSQLNGGSTAGSLARTLSTIRAVTSFDDKPRQSFEDEVSSVGSPSIKRNSNSAFSSSVNSNVSTASFASQAPSPQNGSTKSPNGRLQPSTTNPSLPAVPSVSSVDVPSRDSSLAHGTSKTSTFGSPSVGRTAFYAPAPANEGSTMADDRQQQQQADGMGNGGWDSTVGKAGLGKTGRVINRLVSDNEALKRDLKIERLKADDSRQAARLLEDKMERVISDYESRLLEASVTKTLLARKERQVESLQGAVELEKTRTTAAQDRERTWREEMEKVRSESKRQVEEATGHAALMEGRYNAISSHWRDQGAAVEKAAARMGREVKELNEARRRDDDKISTLRDLCDQQDGNIKVLWQQKEDIARQFAAYKDQQEAILRDIKTNAAAREAEQARTLEEARQVLDKLKWALNVKNTIEWAS